MLYIRSSKGQLVPLNAVAGAANQIAEGNLRGEKLAVGSQDEIGQVALL